MIKLTSGERKELAQHIELITKLEKNLKTNPQLEANIVAYNAAIEDVRVFAGEVHERMSDEFEDKSEKWQESDAGTAAAEMLEAWEQIDLEDADEEGEFTSVLDDLNELPEEPQE